MQKGVLFFFLKKIAAIETMAKKEQILITY
jgi:hypothetical protein